MLKVDRLEKTYGEKKALQNVSFTVSQGTCFGLLGPNGAGKSTTMKILTGIIQADGGNIHIFGKDIKKQSKAILHQIGYVPQSITLYEQLSAYDNLVFFGEMYGVYGQPLKQRIAEALEQTGLSDRAKDAIKTFSGGMKRRINIAAALLHRPKLLILDEPTVGIDPQSRNHIFQMIRSLIKEGMTIIYSTHYMEEVEALCNDIAIIDHGNVITQGPLNELLEKYSQKAVYIEAEGLSGIPQLNNVTKIYEEGQGWVLETDTITETMAKILHLASRNNWHLKRLEMIRPSLENVFLSLTGTKLRD
ncbi:ABC transporter ATP-binding protein [Thermoflavimicrobium daqui]|uniref:ABC transporter ATP-binding protein n=1 Tax=Thermoflavimicrobium daqui TaxID=2137476 RepID=UPI00198046E7|nr:ABC transporter ATP-binding protein [Thermoflavimicrobium daqui]